LCNLQTCVAGKTAAPAVSCSRHGDVELDRTREGIGHRRPDFRVGDQRIQLRARTIGVEGDFGADVREADRLFRQIAGAPDAGDVEIAFELDLELVDRDEPRAASEASEGFGAVSSPSKPGGSSTT
jgi:hypothetical protein